MSDKQTKLSFAHRDRQLLLSRDWQWLPCDRAERVDLGARISRAGQMFYARHISKADLLKVLTFPDLHWKKAAFDDSNGKKRCLYLPQSPLKEILEHFSTHVFFDDYRHEGLRRSVVENAKPHRQSRCGLRLDLQGAFESIKTKHVQAGLRRRRRAHLRWDPSWPLDPLAPDEELARDEAWVLARLLTYRGRLRQGPRTSPFVFEMLLRRLDRRIRSKLRELRFSRFVYTRYVDDLFVSSSEYKDFPEAAKQALIGVIEREGFQVNRAKTRRYSAGVLELPGAVIINGQVLPQRAYLDKLAKALRRRELSPVQLKGHRAFLNQFGRAGRRALRRLSQAC